MRCAEKIICLQLAATYTPDPCFTEDSEILLGEVFTHFSSRTLIHCMKSSFVTLNAWQNVQPPKAKERLEVALLHRSLTIHTAHAHDACLDSARKRLRSQSLLISNLKCCKALSNAGLKGAKPVLCARLFNGGSDQSEPLEVRCKLPQG